MVREVARRDETGWIPPVTAEIPAYYGGSGNLGHQGFREGTIFHTIRASYPGKRNLNGPAKSTWTSCAGFSICPNVPWLNVPLPCSSSAAPGWEIAADEAGSRERPTRRHATRWITLVRPARHQVPDLGGFFLCDPN